MDCVTNISVLRIFMAFILAWAMLGCQEPEGDSPFYIGARKPDMPPPGVDPVEAVHRCVILADTSYEDLTLLEVANELEGYRTFGRLLWALDSLDSFSFLPISAEDRGRYTLFLPSDTALNRFFQRYPDIQLTGDTLVSFLNQHIAVNYYTYGELVESVDSVLTFNESRLYLFKDEAQCVHLNGFSTRIVGANLLCVNGVVHTLSEVIYPAGCCE